MHASVIGSVVALGYQTLKYLAVGRIPSRRALAGLGKLYGLRLERRWPVVVVPPPGELNLGWADILEFQRWRSRKPPVVVVIGAFDGITNDPTGDFIRHSKCLAVLVEPQAGPFENLRFAYGNMDRVALVQAALDRQSGERQLFTAPADVGLPDWIQQVASFERSHVEKHLPPELHPKISTVTTQTVTFNQLIERFSLSYIDILQIDAEGLDGQLLAWFPFARIRPDVIYYEVAHMTDEARSAAENLLSTQGYRIVTIESPGDAVAVAL